MPSPRIKRIAQNLALSAFTFVVCVAVLEIILRLSGYGNVEIYEADPVLYWKLKPNQDCYTKIDHKPVHINSRSTRGPEFEVPKPPNTVRIISLGDSRTFGWGVSEAESYSGVLERLLQEKIGTKKRVEVINAGVNAWSYPQICAYFRNTALKYNPDFVLLGGANLWTQFSEKNSPDFVKKFMMRVRLKNFLRRFAIYHYVFEVKLKEVYEQQRTRFIPVDPKHDTLFKEQQQKDPDAFFRNAIEELCHSALTNGVKPILLYLPRMGETNESNLLRSEIEISRRLNIPLIDVTSYTAPKEKELYLEADPVHFNVQGNQIIATRLFETMSSLITP